MSRHLLVGQYAQDGSGVPVAPGEVVTVVDLVDAKRKLRYGIGRAIKDAEKLRLYPTEVSLDLLVLAALVHAADTRISRTAESEDAWTREIGLSVPVHNVGLWNSVAPLISRMLNFLSGDLWTIRFRDRPRKFQRMMRARPLFGRRPTFDSVSLFSGGMDSLIGAIDLLEAGASPVFVSHAGEAATSEAQTSCFDGLKGHYDDRALARLRVWMSFPDGFVAGGVGENTTRGRSFLFIALGAFAAAGISASNPVPLKVPENGLIALNVPLDPLRLGALSTRTTHPFYLARWNELLSTLGIPVAIDNPYGLKTKGEMAKECRHGPLLQTLLAQSMSCASPSKARWSGHATQHCGYCLPCIIRRAAVLEFLGAGQDPTTYTLHDMKARPLDAQQSEGQQVRSFQFAIRRLQSTPDVAKYLIHKPGPLSEFANQHTALADVYARGMREVGGFLAGVRTVP